MNKCLNCNGECHLYEDFCCDSCEKEWKEDEGEFDEREEDHKTIGDNY